MTQMGRAGYWSREVARERIGTNATGGPSRMELSAGDIIGIMDRAGLVAFAVGGVEVGFRRR